MKTIFIYAVSLLCLINGALHVSAEQERVFVAEYTIQINNDIQNIKNPVVCIHDRTYLPLREIAELLNLYVIWDAENQMIKISELSFTSEEDNTPFTLSGQEASAHPSNFLIKLNGYILEMENPPYVVRDRAYLPLRELSEALGAQVEWDGATETVKIYRQQVETTGHEYPVRLPFKQDNLYGYMDIEGNVIAAPQYTEAQEYSEGVAAVKDKNHLWGYIDADGNTIIPHIYLNARGFSEGVAAVAAETYSDRELYVYHYIDKAGTPVISETFVEARAFHSGLAQVFKKCDNERWIEGYIDKKGTSQREIEHAVDFEDGYANMGDFILNTEFETVFDGTDYELFSLHNGVIRAKKDGKWGVVDFENNIIIDFQYEFLSDYSEGLFAFKNEEGSGYIDINENIIIPPVYASTDEFVNGRAVVTPKKNQEIMFYINKKGEQISEDMAKSYYYIWPNGVMMTYPEDGEEGTYVNFNGEPILPRYPKDK